MPEIVCIVDKSGSMLSHKDDTIREYNRFIAEQAKQSAGVNVTLVLFSSYDDYEIVFQGKNIMAVPALSQATYRPHGNTALWDAIGKTIGLVDQRQGDNRRDEKTAVLIITDGEENDSREYDAPAVKEEIQAHRNGGWEFFFVGAELNAYIEAASIGLAAQFVLPADLKTAEGTADAYAALGRGTMAYLSGESPAGWQDNPLDDPDE